MSCYWAVKLEEGRADLDFVHSHKDDYVPEKYEKAVSQISEVIALYGKFFQECSCNVQR
jgi:hypothetical protein